MTIYRSKPVEIEARQWTGTPEAATPILNWIDEHGGTANWDEPHEGYDGPDGSYPGQPHEAILIRTLEGTMAAKPGDWIIRGTENEFYPCVDSVFRRKYEEIPVFVSCPDLPLIDLNTCRHCQEPYELGHKCRSDDR